MEYIPRDQYESVRKIGLHEYLLKCEPHELVKVSGVLYSVKEHDSVVIYPSNRGWYRYSTGEWGKNALDYLIKVRGMAFKAAFSHLYDSFASGIKTPRINTGNLPKPQNNHERQPLYLPMKDKNGDGKMRAYLQSRGIGENIISSFVRRGILYQGWTRGRGACCVFVGYDYHDLNADGTPKPKHGSRIYINPGYGRENKLDAAGSDKAYSLYLPWNGHNDTETSAEYKGTLHVFESSIDLASYIMIQKIESRGDPHPETAESLILQNVYLSLSSVAPSKSEDSEYVPKALERVLSEMTNARQLGEGIDRITLHFDADEAGRMASRGITRFLERYLKPFEGVRVSDASSRYSSEGVKDENELLIKMLKRGEHKISGTPARYSPVSRETLYEGLCPVREKECSMDR
jgi:hypothetical protein